MWQGSHGQKYTETLDRNFSHLSRCLANYLPVEKYFIHFSYFEHWTGKVCSKICWWCRKDIRDKAGWKLFPLQQLYPSFHPTNLSVGLVLIGFQKAGRFKVTKIPAEGHDLLFVLISAIWKPLPAFRMYCLFSFWIVFTKVATETFW